MIDEHSSTLSAEEVKALLAAFREEYHHLIGPWVQERSNGNGWGLCGESWPGPIGFRVLAVTDEDTAYLREHLPTSYRGYPVYVYTGGEIRAL